MSSSFVTRCLGITHPNLIIYNKFICPHGDVPTGTILHCGCKVTIRRRETRREGQRPCGHFVDVGFVVYESTFLGMYFSRSFRLKCRSALFKVRLRRTKMRVLRVSGIMCRLIRRGDRRFLVGVHETIHGLSKRVSRVRSRMGLLQ